MRIGEAFYKVAMGERIPAAEAERLKNVLNGLETLLALQNRIDMQSGMVRRLDAGNVHIGDDGIWISTAAGQNTMQLDETGMSMWFTGTEGTGEKQKWYRAGASAAQGQIFGYEIGTNQYGMAVLSGNPSTGGAPVVGRIVERAASFSSLATPQMEYTDWRINSHGANTTALVARLTIGTAVTASQAAYLSVVKDGNFAFNSSGSFGGGGKVINIANCSSAPGSNPVDGGVLYAVGGALRWRSSGGTVSTIASA